MNRRPGTESGFTLIEVLIGVTLLAMLAVLIADATRLGGRAWNTAERQTGETDDMDAVQSFLRRTVVRARPAFTSADPSDTVVVFSGAQDTLSLVVPQPGTADEGPWARERFYVARHGTSSALFVSWQLDTPAIANASAVSGNDVLLLEHVAAVRFSYFGPPSTGAAPTWLEQWTNRRRVPDLVRIVIQRDSPQLRPWPELVVGTRVTANAGCIYDALTTACQRAR